MSGHFFSLFLSVAMLAISGCDRSPRDGQGNASGAEIQPDEGGRPELVEFYGGDVRVRKAAAGEWQWHPLAIGAGGHNTALAFDLKDPARMFQISDVAGVIKTVDGGRHWRNSMAGLQGYANGNYGVGSITIDPSDSRVIYASLGRTAENPSGIIRSDDGGESWRWLSSEICIAGEGPTSKKFGGPGILIDPANNQRLYAIDTKRNSGGGGVWISTDGGSHWEVSGLAQGRISGLRFAPGVPGVIWASAVNLPDAPGGMFRSADEGRTWQPAGLAGKDVYNFQFDAGNPATIYAACGSEGIFKTTDGGATWTAINQGLPLDANSPKPQFFTYRYRALDADPFQPGHLVVAADVIRAYYESFDGGATWRRLPVGERHAPEGWMLTANHMGWHTSQVYFHPLQKGSLFVCDFFGTWRSDDGGRTWEIHPYGAEQSCMTTVLPDAQEPNRIYLGIWDHDFLIYHDDAVSPRSERVSGARQESRNTNHHASSIAQDEAHPDTLLAVMNSAALIRSADRGKTWTRIDQGLPADPFWRLGAPVIAADAGVAFLPINGGEKDGGGVYSSGDGGLSWSRAANSSLPAIDVTGRWDPRQNVFAATSDASLLALVSKDRLYLSGDRAVSWTAAETPGPVRTVAVTEEDGRKTLFAGGTDALYRSEDDGKTWSPIWTGQGRVMLLAASSAQRLLIYTESVRRSATEPIEYHLFLSENGGTSWTSLFNQTMPVWRLRAIAFDPFDKDRILASSQWAGTWSAERPR